jgi:hypothetical protein
MLRRAPRQKRNAHEPSLCLENLPWKKKTVEMILEKKSEIEFLEYSTK